MERRHNAVKLKDSPFHSPEESVYAYDVVQIEGKKANRFIYMRTKVGRWRGATDLASVYFYVYTQQIAALYQNHTPVPIPDGPHV